MTPEREARLLDRLKSEILALEQENRELQEQVEQLTGVPLSYGVVIKTGNKITREVPPEIEDFKKGTSVKVAAASLEKYGLFYPNAKVRNVIDRETVRILPVQGGTVDVHISDLRLETPKTEGVETITISSGGTLKEVLKPYDIEVKEGETVILNGFGAVVGSANTVPYGQNAVVKEVLDGGYCEISEGDRTRVVFVGKVEAIEKGDHVVLDPSGNIVVKNNKQKTTDFTVETSMNVEWEQIGGLEETKEVVKEMVELPHSKPEVFKFYNKKPAKGILLYGPPGCGKTLLAKAVATSLAKIYGGNLTESGFIYVKGPEILNPYVGVTEQTIRQIFERARKYKKDTGFPATIFIDEADAILSKRGTGISSDIDKTIVPMFLTEMDGLVDSSAFIILATNRADVLDPAVTRDGRINVKIKVARPDKAAVKDIALINLKSTRVQGNKDTELAEFIAEMVFSTSLKDSVSGAMVAGLVDQAISEAIRRDLKSNKKPEGVGAADVENAIQKMMERDDEAKHEEKPLNNVWAKEKAGY